MLKDRNGKLITDEEVAEEYSAMCERELHRELRKQKLFIDKIAYRPSCKPTMDMYDRFDKAAEKILIMEEVSI